MNPGHRSDLAQLLLQAQQAHQDWLTTQPSTSDPEWPLWYAEFLQPKLPAVLGCARLTRSLLTKLMLDAESEHQAQSPDSPWQDTYAGLLLDRLGSAEHGKLALYHFASCPFCRRVRRAIDKLGIEAQVELRDIFDHLEFRNELMQARGRPTVPVLRCSYDDGSHHYMPESADIIRFLEDHFGKQPS